MTPGNYSVTWGAIVGWQTPDPATASQTLVANGTLSFVGTYTPSTGSITIDVSPGNLAAPWLLTGPDSFSRAGTGDLAITDLNVGNYTLAWGAISGWYGPAPSTVTQTLAADGTLTFVGAYVAQTGSITIDVQPDIINAPWHLEGPDGYLETGSGDATVPNVRVGSYTITWEPEVGYELPPPETQTLVENGTLIFGVEYVPLYLPFPDTADKSMANFQDLYEAMDFEELGKLLHPDHITILQPSTTAQFPDVGETLDIDEELRIHERMFSHQNLTDPLVLLVPAVQAIHFQTLARQGNWGFSRRTTGSPTPRWPCTMLSFYLNAGDFTRC